MTIIEMIREWRRGCSCAGPRRLEKASMDGDPSACAECTRGLVDAIEHRVSREHDDLLARYLPELLKAHEEIGVLSATRDNLRTAICALGKVELYSGDDLKTLNAAVAAAGIPGNLNKASRMKGVDDLASYHNKVVEAMFKAIADVRAKFAKKGEPTNG